MTTQRQIKKLMNPMLEKRDDLELVGQWIYLKPVNHVARTVLIDRTGSADYFKFRWAVINLCLPREFFPIGWGNAVWPTNDLWLWDDPDMAADFYEKLETEALPALRKINTLRQFRAFASNRDNFPWPPRLLNEPRAPLEKAVVDAAIGDFDAALEGCIALTTKKNWNQLPGRKTRYTAVTERLYPLLKADDRKGIAKLLHEWEAFTAEQFGISHIWEQAPFPFETKPSKK